MRLYATGTVASNRAKSRPLAPRLLAPQFTWISAESRSKSNGGWTAIGFQLNRDRNPTPTGPRSDSNQITPKIRLSIGDSELLCVQLLCILIYRWPKSSLAPRFDRILIGSWLESGPNAAAIDTAIAATIWSNFGRNPTAIRPNSDTGRVVAKKRQCRAA